MTLPRDDTGAVDPSGVAAETSGKDRGRQGCRGPTRASSIETEPWGTSDAAGAARARIVGTDSQDRKRDPRDMKDTLRALPWWVRWIAIPALALIVFGSLLVSLITLLVGLLFKVLLFVALVAVLIFVVRKFTSSSSSGGW